MGKTIKSVGAICLSAALALTSVSIPMQKQKVKAAEMKSNLSASTSKFTIDAEDINVDNVNGLTYKGFGMLSGNSTSDLLLDYKSEHPEVYAKLMQYLFGGDNPIITHLKLEMGNDGNNSTGSEAATKRTADEEANVKRNAGWQLIADAKKINPDLKTSVLKWNQPVYIKGDENYYNWFKETILKAYEEYGYMIDYINPNTNEGWNGTWDIPRIKYFKEQIAAETEETIPDKTALKLYKKIKFIITDEAEQFSEDAFKALFEDEEFAESIAAAGMHYPYSNRRSEGEAVDGMPRIATELDKEVWSSENQAVFSNSYFRPSTGKGIGGGGSALEMMNHFIKGFVCTGRTHNIYQPVVGSFYEGGQYSFKELISARDPWSGYVRYDTGLLALSHVCKFAKCGWENDTNTNGIWRVISESTRCDVDGDSSGRIVTGENDADSYMTLGCPDKDDFSTVFVNNSDTDRTYNVTIKNFKKDIDSVEVWETRAADDGAYDENYMKYLGDEAVSGGKFSVTVKKRSIVTVTSLDKKDDAELNAGLPRETERTVLDTDDTGSTQDTGSSVLYADNFEYEGKTVAILDGKGSLTGETEDYAESRGGATGFIPRYTHNINGAYEVVKTDNGNVLRQQTSERVGAWNSSDPNVLIGDFRWTNYAVSVDTCIEETSTKNPYAAVAVRQTGGDAALDKSAGYTFKLFTDGSYKLMRLGKAVAEYTVEEGKSAPEGVNTGFGVWNRITMEAKGSVITVYVNDTEITSYTDEYPVTYGRVGLGCAWSNVCYDNLMISKIEGYAPYYTEYVDNLELYDLTDEKAAKLIYNDKWNHATGQGMYIYQRSASFSTGAGATLTYTFKGTGIEFSGYNKKYATIKVYLDGNVLYEKTYTHSAENMCTIYSLADLTYDTHTVTIELLDGSLTIDAVGILGLHHGDTLPEEPSPSPEVTPSASPTTAPTKAPAATAAPTKAPTVPTASNITEFEGGKYVYDSASDAVAYSGPTDTSAKKIVIPDEVAVVKNGTSVMCKVTTIAADACKDNKSITSVVIGKNVRTIEARAFYGASSLKNIKIKSLVLKKVGANAIKGIFKKAKISSPKKKRKTYKKLFTKKTGYIKSMKLR